MSYHEYPNGKRQHQNGHVLRPARPDYAAIIQANQKRQQANMQTVACSLVDLMGEEEYDLWIASIPGLYDYRSLLVVLQAKLDELTGETAQQNVVVGESYPLQSSVSQTGAQVQK